MADIKILQLTELTSVDRAADYFEIADASDSGNSKRTSVNSMLDLTSHPVGVDDVQILTNKTLTTPTVTVNDNALTLQDNADTTKKLLFQLSGITTGTTRTLTVPDVSDTLVTLAATQTLTGKTLTSPTITTPTINNPTLNTDAVNEFTAANGVTIDGLNIKDGALNTNNSVPNNALSNTGSFGSAWAWASWTPTWTNFTVGNATAVYGYIQIGKIVHFRVFVTLGTTSVMGSGPRFTLPVNARASVYNLTSHIIGSASLLDAAVVDNIGIVRLETTTTAQILVSQASSTYLFQSTVTSAVPFAWGTGDAIGIIGTYEAA